MSNEAHARIIIDKLLDEAGFHYGEGDTNPNWDKFASSIGDALEKDPNISAAIKYMREKPPKKQVIRNDLLEWQEVPPNGSHTHEILVCVRRVRNNLFHGGKFNGHWFTPERSKELLRHSLDILEVCLRASPELREAFDNRE